MARTQERERDVVMVARNRRARHDYHLLESWEAGLVLTGSEVKSLRAGKASLAEAYGHVAGGELWIEGLNIPAYEAGGHFNHAPLRSRKLLLHRREISRLIGAVEQKGLALIPLELYFRRGRAKLRIALARGKKRHDRREEMKRRDAEREMARALRQRT